jgi:hypothetical protein
MGIKDHRKEKLEDKEFDSDVTESFERKELVRLFAVGITFTGVVFKQAVLVNCYFRNCTFIRCDFTGTQIKDCNLKGSSFEACQFRYTSWEKTILDEDFLDRCLPPEENLARDLVRSLRVNFAQIGNYDAVNKAAAIEVALTGEHLYNAAYSRQGYYRSWPKYQGINRLRYVGQHLRWKALDLLWGNGESILRVLLSGAVAIGAAAALLVNLTTNLQYLDALSLCFLTFWGLATQPNPLALTVALTMCRFVLFGLFMAIVVKRLSRR